jgi:hypothetical protein
LADPVEEHQERQEKPRGAKRKTSLIVGLVCVGVVAAVIAVNAGRLADANSAPNTSPAILGVTASPERILPLALCQLVCEATAEDENNLTYTWTASQGDIIGNGATVEWAAPSTEGLFRVSVTVDDGRGGTDERSISLVVKSNSAPEFLSVPSFAQGVRPDTSVLISCPALDADGDEIAYEWHAAHGETSGAGDTITWVAPTNLGSYVVTVIARDTYGGEARHDVLVSVTPGLSPKLGEFVVEAIDHDMLKYESGVWDIYTGESCSVECVVLEGEGPFTYAWTADDGVLTASGAIATWQAPETRGPATIIIDVTDTHGTTTSGQVLMYAEDCTCAFK